MFLVADQQSGFVVGVGLEKYDRLLQMFPTSLGHSLLQSPLKLPTKIVVKKKELQRAILPLATKFDIPVEMTKRLPAISSARRALQQFNFHQNPLDRYS